MRRGRPPLRAAIPVPTRRVGRPSKNDRANMSIRNPAILSGSIPAGAVIRSHHYRRRNFVRRGKPSFPLHGLRSNSASLMQADLKFDDIERSTLSKAKKKSDADFLLSEEPSTSGLQKSPPIVTTNGSPSKEKLNDSTPSWSSIKPGVCENINLLKLIDGPVMMNGELCQFESAKDIVTLENFKKLSPAAQQYLLHLFPTKMDLVEKEDGTLEPKFSAFKNEYFTADLLDYTERLRSGEILPTGEIARIPQQPQRATRTRVSSGRKTLSPRLRSSSPSSWSFKPNSSGGTNGQLTVAASSPKKATASFDRSPSPPSLPPLPKLRINMISKRITFIPKEGLGLENGWSSASDFKHTSRSSLNGGDEMLNGNAIVMKNVASNALSGSVTTEIDLTPMYTIEEAGEISPTCSDDDDDVEDSRLSSGPAKTNSQSKLGCPPAYQRSRSRRKR